jgi:hypothetical protein
VIDLDEICRSLGSHGHDHPWHVKRMAERIRDDLEAKAAEHPGRTFVVRSLPNASDRAAVAERLGAEVVVLAVPADEAVDRAHSDGRPSWTEQAIRDWWGHYEPSPLDTTFDLTGGDSGST